MKTALIFGNIGINGTDSDELSSKFGFSPQPELLPVSNSAGIGVIDVPLVSAILPRPTQDIRTSRIHLIRCSNKSTRDYCILTLAGLCGCREVFLNPDLPDRRFAGDRSVRVIAVEVEVQRDHALTAEIEDMSVIGSIVDPSSGCVEYGVEHRFGQSPCECVVWAGMKTAD